MSLWAENLSFSCRFWSKFCIQNSTYSISLYYYYYYYYGQSNWRCGHCSVTKLWPHQAFK